MRIIVLKDMVDSLYKHLTKQGKKMFCVYFSIMEIEESITNSNNHLLIFMPSDNAARQ